VNVRLCWLVVGFGVLLRLLAVGAHELPRGDVVLDVGVTRSLVAGDGFASGFVRGVPKLVGEAPLPPQDRADQHAPLWPLLGALPAWLLGDAFSGLRLLSLLLGCLLLPLVAASAERLLESLPRVPAGLPAAAAALVAASFLAIDASANGSLYTAQALLVLLLVEALAAARPSLPGLGVLLGALLLLNHQCAVLLPVPLLVLCAGAQPGRRLAGVGLGVLVAGVALLLQLPWWWRNAQVFGSPFFSVNDIYFLYRAGVPAHFELQQGVPLWRFDSGLDLGLMLSAGSGFLLPNLLYLLATGLLLWPVLLALSLVGALPLLGEALRTRDRRLLALLCCTALLAGVALLWPATKLRYLVCLLPLVVLLGVRTLARSPGRTERRLALLLGTAWLGLLVLTRDDLVAPVAAVAGEMPPDRVARWVGLAVGGLLLVGLPLLLHARGAGPRGRALLLGAALLVSAGASLGVAWLPGPHTAYHATPFLPDFFGRDAEAAEQAEMQALARAREAALAAGSRCLAGPIGLLAWSAPALVEYDAGATAGPDDAALAALVAAGRIDHVLLVGPPAERLPEELRRPGASWLEGRLVVREHWPATPRAAACVLAEVARP